MAIAPLEELRTAYPDAEIYLNGELTVDFPEDVKIPISQNQMFVALISANKLKFSYCSLVNAISLLCDQYAVSSVEIKIVSF
ncbi:MAG: hypothetical protein ACFCU5_05705 [Pleurocapsa sp.]